MSRRECGSSSCRNPEGSVAVTKIAWSISTQRICSSSHSEDSGWNSGRKTLSSATWRYRDAMSRYTAEAIRTSAPDDPSYVFQNGKKSQKKPASIYILSLLPSISTKHLAKTGICRSFRDRENESFKCHIVGTLFRDSKMLPPYFQLEH